MHIADMLSHAYLKGKPSVCGLANWNCILTSTSLLFKVNRVLVPTSLLQDILKTMVTGVSNPVYAEPVIMFTGLE